MPKKKDSLPTLEKSLGEINQLVEKMEGGELSLEQSLLHFERGITLIRHCQKVLGSAEQKVQQLIQKNGKDTLSNYNHSDEEGTDDDDNIE